MYNNLMLIFCSPQCVIMDSSNKDSWCTLDAFSLSAEKPHAKNGEKQCEIRIKAKNMLKIVMEHFQKQTPCLYFI